VSLHSFGWKSQLALKGVFDLVLPFLIGRRHSAPLELILVLCDVFFRKGAAAAPYARTQLSERAESVAFRQASW